jgi:lipid A 4'-phosphatase
MHYLKFRCSRILLLSFLLFSITVMAFPAIDLFVSGLFFDGASFPHDQWWQKLLQIGLKYFLWISVLSVAGIYLYNRVFRRNVLKVDGRRLLFVVLVLITGPGLIVNLGLKDNFGRARPRDVAEFGGAKQFTPAFAVSHECRVNCSFSSGDAAGGFFALALAMALTRRRAFYLAGLAFGLLQSFARVSAGAHFFSDTMVSFFVMMLVADVLYFYVVLTRSHREQARLAGNVFKPSYRTLDALSLPAEAR